MEARVEGENGAAAAVVRRLSRVFHEDHNPRSRDGSAGEWPSLNGGRRPTRCLSDGDIGVLLGEGHEQTLAELYDRYGRIAYKVSIRITHHSPLAEEAVEATLTATWQGNGNGLDSTSAGANVLALVHRESVERARRAGPERELPGCEEAWPPSGGAWAELERQPVQAALMQLQGAERHLLVLAYYAGLTLIELSDGPTVTTATVIGRVQDGLARLTTALSSDRGWLENPEEVPTPANAEFETLLEV